VAGEPGWRMDLPQGWVSWQPGSPDLDALSAAAAGNALARRSLVRRLRTAEREARALPGQVLQIGVRVADPRSGTVSASMTLLEWERPTTDDKPLNARRHLTALEALEPDPERVYRHREATIEKVPAGQLVLRNEVWRPRRRMGWVVELETTLFPRDSESMYELGVRSRHGDLQPQLMADLSLMAHSLHIT